MNKAKAIQQEKANPNHDVITLLDPSSPISEAYRRIKVGIEFSSVDNINKVIQITSSNQGEGKTLTLLNIAVTFAEDDKKVLIIDMDLRRPEIHHAFKAVNKDGLTDYLGNDLPLSTLIKHSKNKNIDFINSGSKVPYPLKMLNSTKLKDLMKVLRDKYDYIFIDCPPILVVSDALIVSRFSDSCIFVVSQIFSDRKSSIDAVKYLKNNHVNVLGAVFTNVTKKNSDYTSYYYQYDHYYKHYDDSPKKKKSSNTTKEVTK